MITVSVYKQGSFPVSTKKLRDCTTKTLEENGLTSDFEVSLALVGRDRMLEIGKTYYGDTMEHPIFTFLSSETKEPFLTPNEKPNQLGEIIISYPMAIEESKKENKLVEDIICELAQHGALHLLGIHH